jgi:hypothetical protein
MMEHSSSRKRGLLPPLGAVPVEPLPKDTFLDSVLRKVTNTPTGKIPLFQRPLGSKYIDTLLDKLLVPKTPEAVAVPKEVIAPTEPAVPVKSKDINAFINRKFKVRDRNKLREAGIE